MRAGLAAAILAVLLFAAECAHGPGSRAHPPSIPPERKAQVVPPPPKMETIPEWGEAGGVSAPVPIVRIGIVPDASEVEIGSDGDWRVGIVGSNAETEKVRAGERWTFRADGELLRTTDGRGTARGGARDTLYLFPDPDCDMPMPMRVAGKPYRGEILVFASGGGKVTAVDVLDLESYVRGVVRAEIGGGGPEKLEAIKAQAVAARSYTLACLARWSGRGFDLLPTVEDQVYEGMEGERPEIDRAVFETCGVVALSGGRPIEAFYSSTCGGTMAAPEEVWDRPARPYLRIHADRPSEGEESFCAASSYHRWKVRWDGSSLEKILKSTLPKVTGAKNPSGWGRLSDLSVVSRSGSGRVEEMKIVFDHKTFRIGGDKVRWILKRPNGGGGLWSARILDMSVSRRRGRVRSVAIEGAGYGHGVGLCQMGAIGMSKAGYTFDQIVRFYYPGIDLVRAYGVPES
ncbi:MAG: SpoIID/LytB domain-containing protein [Candidatus Eisenbacteria bacterium]|nr:SpoIID/LytB domain-containing protein [Candidatus Eisenbacteria bacterium]